MTTAKLFYFLFFAAAASLVPFLSLYYQGLGLSGREIGFLTGVIPLITLVGSSIWGAVADATHKHHQLLMIAIIGAWISVAALSQAKTFLQLIPAAVMYAFFIAPVVPLVDNSVMAWLGEHGRKEAYGRQRVWGSYGWGLSGAASGILFQYTGLSWAFGVFLVIALTYLITAARLPVYSVSIGKRFWQGLRLFAANRHWLIFLSIALIMGMSLSITLTYLFIFLEEMGANHTIMGFVLMTSTLSEIPIFLAASRLMKRWNTQFLLAVSLAAMVVRAFAFVNMTAPWQALFINLLHGPTFSLMWIAGVAYADKSAPPGMGATAQGVFNGTVIGLGWALGAFIGGFLYQDFGITAPFKLAGWAPLITLLLFTWIYRKSFLRQIRA